MFFSGGAVLGGWRLLCRESLKMTTLVSRKPYPFCQFHEIKKKAQKVYLLITRVKAIDNRKTIVV